MLQQVPNTLCGQLADSDLGSRVHITTGSMHCDIPLVTSLILEKEVYHTQKGRKGGSLLIPSFRLDGQRTQCILGQAT